MPTAVVNLDTSQYVRVNAGFNALSLQAHRDSVRIAFSETRPAYENTAFHLLGGNGTKEPFNLPFIDINVWALAVTTTSSLIVTELTDINAPKLSAFSEMSVTENEPEVQINSQYGVSGKVRTVTSLGGSAGFEDGQFKASSGTGPAGVGAIFSDRQMISKPGQGAIVRFTARFPQNIADSRQVAGPATALDSMTFGYDGVEFGVTYGHNGNVIIQSLQITTQAGGAETATVTINGTGYSVDLTSGSVQHNAYEIAVGLASQVLGFIFAQNDDTVIVRSLFAAPADGAFTFSSSTAVAAFTEIAAGVSPTREFTAQADWNADTKADLDPTKLNHYTIQYNGSVRFYVQDDETGRDVLVHEVHHTNSSTEAMFSINAFRLAWSVTNLGNTTNIDVFGTEAAAFIEGMDKSTDASHSESGLLLAVSTVSKNILTIKCRETFGTKVNLGRIVPRVVTAATDGNKGAIVEICKDATFSGETNYQYHDELRSIGEVDTTPNDITGGDCIATLILGPSDSANVSQDSFNEIIVPGGTLTIGMRVPSGGAADMDASIIWNEDL